jgi:hypothetical protein
MNSRLKPILFIPIFCFLFLSCIKDDATNLSLTKQSVALKVGQSDTLKVTVNYTGDLAKVPITVTVSDTEIASAEFLTAQDETNSGNSSFSRTIVIKAFSSGTASVVIHAGTQNITCPATITQTSLVLNQSVVLNYGMAIETSDNNVFVMYFFPETFQLDREGGLFAGKGQFIHFESFFPATNTSLPAGTFFENANGAVNTFLPGDYYVENGQSYPYGTYIETIDKNQVTYTLIKSGNYTVKNEGISYYIEGDLVTETDEIVHFSYTGDIAVDDKAEKPEVVTPQFTKGDLFYVGDYYNMGFSHTFFAYLETSNVDINSNALDGEVLVLQINTHDYCTTSIPSGAYKVLTQSKYEEFAVSPFTLVPGNFHLYRGESVTGGCWYYDTNSRKRLISGSVEINYLSDHYEMKYSLYDRVGSLVTGSFNGKLNFKSFISSAPAKVKSEELKKCNPVILPSLEKSQSKSFGRLHENYFRPMGMK